jgi:hypothetical protein
MKRYEILIFPLMISQGNFIVVTAGLWKNHKTNNEQKPESRHIVYMSLQVPLKQIFYIHIARTNTRFDILSPLRGV